MAIYYSIIETFSLAPGFSSAHRKSCFDIPMSSPGQYPGLIYTPYLDFRCALDLTGAVLRWRGEAFMAIVRRPTAFYSPRLN